MPQLDRNELLDFLPDQLADGVRRLAKRWMKRTGALFLGLGRRKREGSLVDEWCVKFYVGRKLKRPDKRKKIPGSVSLRLTTRGHQSSIRLPTDVVAVKRLKHLCTQAGRIAYIYNENSPKTQGSLAALVEEPEMKTQFLLTAGHVGARNLETAHANPGERVFDRDGSEVGSLAFAPDMSTVPVDAALVSPSTTSVSHLLRRKNDQPVTDVCPLQEVIAGAPDGYTMLSWVKERMMIFHGCSYGVPYTYKVGVVIFPTLMHFECSATTGDSGALVVDGRNRAVGMHILGIEGEESFCLPIDDVLRKCTPGGPLRIVA